MKRNKETKDDVGVRYHTYKLVKKEEGKEGVTVLARITTAFKQEMEDVYKLGFSFCSPLDTYNKRKGQLIASGRLLTEGRNKYFLMPYTEGIPLKQQFKDVAIVAAKFHKIKWMADATTEDLV